MACLAIRKSIYINVKNKEKFVQFSVKNKAKITLFYMNAILVE